MFLLYLLFFVYAAETYRRVNKKQKLKFALKTA
jgi:hypothetical protein